MIVMMYIFLVRRMTVFFILGCMLYTGIPVAELTGIPVAEAKESDYAVLLISRRRSGELWRCNTWEVPLDDPQDIVFFKEITTCDADLTKEGFWHPWLGRTLSLMFLKNGVPTGHALHIANYDCAAEHCWFYVVDSPSRNLLETLILDSAEPSNFFPFKNDASAARFWKFIKKLGIEELGTEKYDGSEDEDI